MIGNTVFFFEPQKDPGLAYVEKMLDIYNKAYPARRRARGAGRVAHRRRNARGAPPDGPGGRGGRDRQAPQRSLGRAQQRRAPRREHEEGGQRPRADGLRAASATRRSRASPTSRCPTTSRRTPSAASPAAAAQFMSAAARSCRSSRSARRAAGIGHLNTQPRRGRRRALRAAGDRLLRPAVPLAVADARREEPEPHLEGHQGEAGRERLGGRQDHPHRRRGADVHVLLQGPRRAPGLPDRLVLRRLLRQDPRVEVRRTRSCSSARPPRASAPAR